ncbi:MAG: SoxR reducing system RseC family protein [Candidatus Stygibacter australis]|nr:SoxR reducing system RseC family protein [Candidatus Stygibacter australis]MDP8321883.1 SoxR reducing system RseC family protein [Candidatus Stygibacter australis]
MQIIEDIAIVSEVKDRRVLVKLPESDSCASCAVHGICQVGENTSSHWIDTDLRLQVGDKVKIFISPALRIMSSFIVFLLPVIMMILVYLIFKYLFVSSENVSILGSVLSLGLSGLIIYAIDKKWSKKLRFEILERVSEEEYQQEISDEDTPE